MANPARKFIMRLDLLDGLVQGCYPEYITDDDLPRSPTLVPGQYFMPVLNIDQNGRVRDGVSSVMPSPGSYTSITFASDGTATFGTGGTPPSRILSYTTTVGSVGTTPTALFDDVIPANTLTTNNDVLEFNYSGRFLGAAADTRQLIVQFGGTTMLDTGALAITTTAFWTLTGSIIREDATVVRYLVTLTTGGIAVTGYTGAGRLTGKTLSVNQQMLVQATSAGAGAADNDIQGYMGYVEKIPA